jgi:phosphate starvation-inducible protein PhoH
MSKKNRRQDEKPTTDTSPKIFQRDKIKDGLSIKELNWTEKQKSFIEQVSNKDVKLVMVKGPAGCSKTLLSTYCALRLLSEKKVSDITYIRSAVESSDASIGFLPGTADEKMAFYNLPFMDKLDELLPRGEVDKIIKDQRILTFPINFCRGLNWNTKAILLDECQNSSLKEIVTVLTRIGKFSKCFVLADPDQADLSYGKQGGFEKLYDLFSDEDSKNNGIITFEFNEDDIMRSELVKFLTKKLKTIKKESMFP